MFQPISSFLVSQKTIEKFKNKGYHYYEDIQKSSDAWVKSALSSIRENNRTPTLLSALDCSQLSGISVELANKSIITMSCSLDKALGDGVPLGQIVEICGLPGSGRTQLCLQLCVSVQIPVELGGIGGQAAYIDTSSNFKASRLLEIAKGCRKIIYENSNISEESWSSSILRGVHYIETFGVSQFCASLILLEKMLKENENIKLVVIDNIAFPFKGEHLDSTRTGLLCRNIAILKKIAVEKNIAIVITNEMSTRIGIGVVGALGDVWAHCSGIRLYMATPHVAVTHNMGKPDSAAEIQITKDGIRDCT